MQRLRCNLEGEIFTASTGEDKCDAKSRVMAMIALLNYRLKDLLQSLGIPTVLTHEIFHDLLLN